MTPAPSDREATPIHPLVAYGRARGNGSLNVRDAAHEAFHAIAVGAKDWDREKVHAKLMRKFGRLRGGAMLWVHELQARAVEQIVSKHFGYDCGSLDKWVSNSILEAIKNRLPYGEYEDSLKIATNFLTSKASIEAANAIIARAQDAK